MLQTILKQTFLKQALIFRKIVAFSNINRLKNNREDDYEIFNFLGKGSSARVFQGINIVNNQKVVIKMFKRLPEEDIRYEIEINKKLLHSLPQNNNIQFIKLLDVIINEGCKSYTLIYEFWPGVTLNQLIPVISLPKSIKVIKMLLYTLEYIHSIGIVHRDLKPTNILITNQQAKLFDFGLAKYIQKGEVLKGKNFGTKCYKTPEVIYRFPGYDQSADIWNLGLIFAEMVTNKKHLLNFQSDFQMLSKMASFCNLIEEDRQLIDERLLNQITLDKTKTWECIASKNKVDKNVSQLIKSMIELNPKKRITIPQLLKHQLFSTSD